MLRIYKGSERWGGYMMTFMTVHDSLLFARWILSIDGRCVHTVCEEGGYKNQVHILGLLMKLFTLSPDFWTLYSEAGMSMLAPPYPSQVGTIFS